MSTPRFNKDFVPSACLIGAHGLIGAALASRLGETTHCPTAETKVIYHFGSYSHQTFEENPEYFMARQISEFTELLALCSRRDILFVWPSSALVYEPDTPFSRFKKTLESLVSCYKARVLTCRIFPVYGPNENRSVISKWCAEMARGERPVVYGDGSQCRDFIHVDDVAEQIIALTDQCKWNSKTADIASGGLSEFNWIVGLINRELGTSIEPRYVKAPVGYNLGGTTSSSALQTKVRLEDGIRSVLAIHSRGQYAQKTALEREAYNVPCVIPQSARPIMTNCDATGMRRGVRAL